MGQQNIIDRECLANPGRANLYGCRWCGQYPRRVYFYAGRGPFCNAECWMSFADVSRSDFDYIHPRRF